MKEQLLSLLFIVSTVSCHNKNGNAELSVIDISTSIHKQIESSFTLNQIARKITYIPIATTDQYLFGSVSLAAVSPNYYFFLTDRARTIFYTDKKGEVIHSFSRVGNGPGEYMIASYVYIDKDEKYIHVFDQMKEKYIVYNLNGDFQDELSMKEKGIGHPLLMTDDYLIARGRPEDNHRFVITDGQLNIRERYMPIDYNDEQRFFAFNQFCLRLNKDIAVIHFAFEDTVYTLSDKGLNPIFLLKKGEYTIPEEESLKMMNMDNPAMKNSVVAMFLGVLPDHYLIQYHFNGTIYQEIWDRSTSRLISRLSNENGQLGYPFRLPSGKTIGVSLNILSDRVVSIILPADVAAGENIADVDEDDNPVLVILEL